MTNGTDSSIPPFHSLPFSAYYRTECQDKYSTSRLAHHVAYDNECASSLQLTPCFDSDQENNEGGRFSLKPAYKCNAVVHGHQYSRKVRCFGPWVDAAGFANVTLSEISQKMNKANKTMSNSSHASKA